MTATAAEQLAILTAMIGGQGDRCEASDGPGERCVADADVEFFADREERRDERAMWGGAA